jgi:hypothetical protein
MISGRGPLTPIQAGTATEALQMARDPRDRAIDESIKIKHQIDLNSNLQMSHDLSINAFNKEPNSGTGEVTAPRAADEEEAREKRGRDSTLAFSGAPSAHHNEHHGS